MSPSSSTGAWRRPSSRRSALLLAAGAVNSRALSLHQAPHRRAAASAGFAFASVDPVTVLEVARASIDGEIAQARAAGTDSEAQRTFDRAHEFLAVHQR